MQIYKDALELSTVPRMRIIIGSCLMNASKQYCFPTILFALILVSSTFHISVDATSNLEPASKDGHQQLLSEFENMRKLDSINNSNNSGTPLAGGLQIPYSGLLTKSLSPAIAEKLGLNSTITRGQIVMNVNPGSPAEKAGIQPLNMARAANPEEIIPSGGDIILAIDGSTNFATDYDSFEQYIYENRNVGDNVTLTIVRGAQVKDVQMIIEAIPRFLWYENPDERIKMKYPSDWRISETDLSAYEVVNFLSPELSNNSASFANVKIIPSNITLDELESVEEEDTANTRHLHMLPTKVANLPGYESIFYDYSDTNHALKIVSLFTIEDGNIYRLNFATDRPKYEDYLPLAREMIESFQFIE